MFENIILVLSTTLKIIYVGQLLPSLNIENVKFESVLESDFIGFYDWLKIGEDQICGVRLIPFDFAEDAVSKIKETSYSKLLSGSVLEIYFTNVFNYKEDISCDQDFGNAKIYISEDLEYAVGFDIANLTLKERENLDLLLKGR